MRNRNQVVIRSAIMPDGSNFKFNINAPFKYHGIPEDWHGNQDWCRTVEEALKPIKARLIELEIKTKRDAAIKRGDVIE